MCRGHVPIEHSKVFNFFLKRGGKIFATVTGNKFFNIGLEWPCTYTDSLQLKKTTLSQNEYDNTDMYRTIAGSMNANI